MLEAAVQTFNNIDEAGIAVLEAADYEVGPDVKDPSAIILRSHQLQPSEIADTVEVIARAGAGTDNINVEDATRRGIVVVKATGANSNAVAEAVQGMSIAVARNMFEAARFMSDVADPADKKAIEGAKKQFIGSEIKGKRLGVVGLGEIGVIAANNGLALGMNVQGYEKYPDPENMHKLDRRVVKTLEFDEAFDGADVVTLHIPLLEETTGIVGPKQLERMSPNGLLINFARPGIVDERAIKDWIGTEAIRYAVDFPSLLHGSPGVYELPHLGASTAEAERNAAIISAQQSDEYLKTGAIKNSVNFPDVDLPWSTPTRVVILHGNEPGMIGGFGDAFGDRGINVADGRTPTRKDTNTGVAIYDLDAELGQDLRDALEEIRATDGVYRVRLLQDAR